MNLHNFLGCSLCEAFSYFIIIYLRDYWSSVFYVCPASFLNIVIAVAVLAFPERFLSEMSVLIILAK